MSAPNLEEIVEAGVNAGLETVYTSQPAIVVSFDKATHTVSAQPINQQYHRNEDGDFDKVTPTIIPHIPVYYLGSGNNRITFPVQKGSIVLLVHTTHTNEGWHHSTGTGVVDPQDMRRHDYTDAVAIAGLLTISGAKAPSAKVVDNAMVIHVDEKLLLGGDTSTKPIIRTTDLQSVIRGVLSDSAVVAAINLGSGVGAAIDTYFLAHPISGSSVVEAK